MAGEFDFFEEVIGDPLFGIRMGMTYKGADYDFVDHGETIEKDYTAAGVRNVTMRRVDVRVSDFSDDEPTPKQLVTFSTENGIKTYRLDNRRISSTGISYKLLLIQEFSD